MADEEATTEMKPFMFYVGAQVTADGDMLPGSFTVFPKSIALEDMFEVIARRITQDLQDLPIEQSSGQIGLAKISTWQEFADIKIDDQVKSEALVYSAVTSTAAMMFNSDKLHELLAAVWTTAEIE